MDERALIDAILARPDDEAARLSYADHLRAHGDVHGELIRLACARDRLERDDPARTEIEAQIQRLPVRMAWFGPPPIWARDVREWRGMPYWVRAPARDFAAHAERELFPIAPVIVFEPTPAEGTFGSLADSPALARLRRLEIAGLPSDRNELATLLASPHLASLRELSLWGLSIDAALIAIAARAPLPSLVRLDLRSTILDVDAVDALLAWNVCEHVDTLDLRDARFSTKQAHERLATAFGSRALFAQRKDPSLIPGILPRLIRFSRLHIADWPLGVEDAERLARSPLLADVTSLSLRFVGQDDAAFVRAIAASEHLHCVEVFVLGGPITDQAMFALGGAASLARLRTLVLGEEASGDLADGRGVSEGGLRALADSQRLPSLERVELTHTWRMRYDGREDLEVRQFRGAARVLEVHVQHIISP